MNTLTKMNLTVAKKVDQLEIEIAETTDLDKLCRLAELTLTFLKILSLLDDFGEKRTTKVG
jgi:hypothetical protein